MKSSLRMLAFCAALPLAACNNHASTDELVEGKVAAERAKDLQAQVSDLKAGMDKLAKENELLKQELTAAKAKVAAVAAANSQAKVASRDAKKPAAGKPADEKASPAQLDSLHEELTGGSSFK